MDVIRCVDGTFSIVCDQSEYKFMRQFFETSLQMYKQMHDNPVMRKMMLSKEKKAGHKGGFQMMLDAGEAILHSFNNPL